MRHVRIALLGMLLGLTGPIFAADTVETNPVKFDLTTLERAPPKLPPLHSKHPEYCLLVFGPDAHKRVWLVQDGDVLYVDRQGNGDLTDPDDRVSANTDYGESAAHLEIRALPPISIVAWAHVSAQRCNVSAQPAQRCTPSEELTNQ